jgi:uncharacterized membrane protein
MMLAALAGVFWGVGEIFTKLVLHGGRVGPVTAIAVRSTVALPILWLAYVLAVHAWKTEPRDWPSAGAPTLLKLVLGSGFMAGAAGMIAFYAALHLGEISRIKPVAFAVAPATAVVLGMLVLGEPVTAKKIAGVALILAGVVLLTMR